MPIIEFDMLIAYVNIIDKLHRIASMIFTRIVNGELVNVAVPTSVYMEYELILRSKGYNEEIIRKDTEAFRLIKNLDEVPLTSNILIEASRLRNRYGLSYFDSLHAASALLYDKTIISVDRAYRRIKGLKVLNPRELVGNVG